MCGEVTGEKWQTARVGFRLEIEETACSFPPVGHPSDCLVLVPSPINESVGYGSMQGMQEWEIAA